MSQPVVPPGLYVYASTRFEFNLLTAMELVGQASIVGERYDPQGVMIRTFVVGQGPMLPNGQISVGREFFVTALRDYDSWELKWWRECVQNAVDAGASEVWLSAQETADGVIASCTDNGRGMSEDTLINKFLVLGGTTKDSASGTAGGFGKAKELLVLPWLSWQVQSGEMLVSGVGIQYDVSRADPIRGTKLSVLMPLDKCTQEHHATEFLKRCWLPNVTFHVGPDIVKADRRPGKIVNELPGKVEIRHNKSIESDREFLVRVHGIYMFDRWISSDVKGLVTVEVTAPSIEILTANRDGFRDSDTRQYADRFVSKMAADTKSALSAKSKKMVKEFEGAGQFQADKYLQADCVNDAILKPIRDRKGRKIFELDAASLDKITQRVDRDRARNKGAMDWLSAGVANLDIIDVQFCGQSHLEAAIAQLVWTPDFYLMNDYEEWKVPVKFMPERMTATVRKLAKLWAELCRFVFIQLGSKAQYGVGFWFSPEAAAGYHQDDNTKKHWLLLNPFRENYSSKPGLDSLRSITSEDELKWLYAAAIHEVTHMADNISYHNESFAGAFTENLAKCADGWKKVKRISQAIRARNLGGEAEERQEEPSYRAGQPYWVQAFGLYDQRLSSKIVMGYVASYRRDVVYEFAKLMNEGIYSEEGGAGLGEMFTSEAPPFVLSTPLWNLPQTFQTDVAVVFDHASDMLGYSTLVHEVARAVGVTSSTYKPQSDD